MERVRKIFDALLRFAPSNFLRREISERMQERLDLLKLPVNVVLDAGCGEGEDLIALRQRYRGARMIGADFSSAMLTKAREQYLKKIPRLHRWIGKIFAISSQPRWLCEDFSSMSLPNDAVDLIWSNLSLHWHPQPQKVFKEWQRVLRVDGALMFSCFGPDTFKEVRRAFNGVDNDPHTMAFTDMHDLGDMLIRAGFPSPVMDRETITVTYESPADLIADVRAFGGNALAHRRRGLVGREAGRRVMEALEEMRGVDGMISLTFEVLYGHAFKAAPTQAWQGEEVVQFVPRVQGIGR
jgi:malonyl-CoA O-methyltransferase